MEKDFIRGTKVKYSDNYGKNDSVEDYALVKLKAWVIM